MEIRFTVAQALFGLVFGAVAAHYFAVPFWVYLVAIPAMGALAYGLSLWRLRSLGLKANTTFLDYIEERKKRWR
jgi:hypothetical protein